MNPVTELKSGAALQIVMHPHPILLTPTERVVEFDRRYFSLIMDMFATMKQKGYHGIGLAANQVGYGLRIAVLAVPGWPDMALVNPWIVRKKGYSRQAEGCLSIPGVRMMVERAATVWIAFQDELGIARELKAKGLLARAIQHELDHLDGLTCLERTA
jgi:peptide deformylase